jgi:hypothetical protein
VSRFRLPALLVLLVMSAVLGLTGCSTRATPLGSYSGLSTPKAALDTFFTSASRQDYATTYSCYYDRYRQTVTQPDFVRHREQASVLLAYHIDSVSVTGNSAVASATLTFGPSKGSATKVRTVAVREDLVSQAGTWRIRVW